MKRFIVVGIIASLLISCSSPAATPTLEPTREEPKKSAPVDIVIDTATAVSTATATVTYTPIPATFTNTPTRAVKRSMASPGKIYGSGNEMVKVTGKMPGSIVYTIDNALGFFLIFSDGTRTPLTRVFTLSPDNPIVAIEVTGTGSWEIEFIEPATPSLTPAKKPTLKSTVVRSAPTIAIVPTKKPTDVVIPTVFLPPTDVPPPPPAACCKHCTPGKSKACGDSCISIDKTCHQPPGCAC